MKTVFVNYISGTIDGRGIIYHFSCPNCKRGKDETFDSMLHQTTISHTCNYCGNPFYVNIHESKCMREGN